MRWKALFTVLLIVVIISLMMTTDLGNKYAELLKFKVGDFLSGMLDFEPRGQFQMRLKSNKEALFGRTYSVVNSSFAATGICQGSLVVGNTVLTKEGLRCNVELRNLKGRFEYTVGGSIKADGSASSIIVDDHTFTPSAEDLDVSLEVIPVDGFFLSGFKQRTIETTAVTGSIERFKVDGSTKSTESLESELLTIKDFEGSIELENEELTLTGLASSVSGANFDW